MKETTGKITFKGGPLTLLGDDVKVGQKAPDFTVIGAGLNPIKLSDYDGKVRVLALYPSIDTGVCQLQNKRFNAEAANLGDTVVLSISCDLPFAQSRFCAAEGLDKVVTASDHRDVEFGTKYGYLIKELRLLTRGTIIVDKEGVIQYAEICPEVTDEPNYDGALEVVKELL
ncbi:thiol peroxidase [Mangrovibacterium lignilyticum]|uniref:thiol peroxidase n=1 Tax=Mangrovibacterium lignilyticum TaxID=2668052 RepID=UPI0013D4C562|nr:thiol peroxidase [Mangrovibacterium lignilyticum]